MLGPTTTGTAICCSGGVEGVEGVGNIDQPLKICESRSESSQVTQVRERLLIACSGGVKLMLHTWLQLQCRSTSPTRVSDSDRTDTTQWVPTLRSKAGIMR